jgi:hypothetical protein
MENLLMASVSRINGLRLVRNLSQGAFNAQTELAFHPSTDATIINVGDIVKLAGDARAASGAPTVTRITNGSTDVPYGVVVGIAFEGVGDTQNVPPVTDLNTPVYVRASTDRYVYVCVDPNAVYEAQLLATSVAAATITANVGLNAPADITAGSTTTGSSGMSIGTPATTATLPLKIVGFPNRPDNIPGDTYFSYHVKLNSAVLGQGTGTLGV